VYFAKRAELDGRTYAEALLAFPEAAVIGIVVPDGKVILNPPASRVIPAGSSVVAIARDDDRLRFRPIAAQAPVVPDSRPPAPRAPERVLVIGWSRMGGAMLRALVPHLAPGSSVRIVAREEFVEEADRRAPVLPGVEASFVSIGTDISQLEAVVREGFGEIMVLGYRSGISVADADANTILTMLHLSRVLGDERGASTRIIAEILDSRRSEFARIARVDDLVLSDSLAALMMAQIAESPRLAEVFDELFDARGASLALERAEDFVQPGCEVNFAQLVAAASARGSSAIGIRLGADRRTILNPPKEQRFTLRAGDRLVTVSGSRAD